MLARKFLKNTFPAVFTTIFSADDVKWAGKVDYNDAIWWPKQELFFPAFPC